MDKPAAKRIKNTAPTTNKPVDKKSAANKSAQSTTTQKTIRDKTPQESTQINDIVEALTFVAQQGCPELAKDAGVVMQQYPELVKRAAWAQLSTETRRSLQQLLRDERAA